MRTFLLKAKHFFKRNIYPITVTMCTVLVLSIITIAAYTSIKNSNEQIAPTNTPTVSDNQPTVDKVEDEEKPNKPVTPPKDEEPSKPVVVSIIFDLPFEGAVVSKNYTDNKLVYDATTDLWCTHQAIDFACNEGQKIKSVYDGTITKIESSMMYGTVVYLKVSNEITVVFKGLASNPNVKEGDQVKKGDVLGVVTSFLAEKADGVHLHLEVLKKDKLSDPNEYFAFNK